MAKTFTHQPQHESKLKTLLLTIVPVNAEGNKTLTHLASLIPMSRWAVQKWLKEQYVPAERVPKLIQISGMGGRKPLTPRDFDPFVYGEAAEKKRQPG